MRCTPCVHMICSNVSWPRNDRDTTALHTRFAECHIEEAENTTMQRNGNISARTAQRIAESWCASTDPGVTVDVDLNPDTNGWDVHAVAYQGDGPFERLAEGYVGRVSLDGQWIAA